MRYDEQGKPYKEVYGTSSRRAVDHITRDLTGLERARRLYLDEGVSSSRAYLQPGLESAEDVLDRLTAGLRSAMTYSGARTIPEFQSKVRFDFQSRSGYDEGQPRVGEWVL
jgi:IMP dehydrogenase